MAAVIGACSWLSVPATVPFTMQTFGVFAALYLLGGKRGTAAIALYIAMGLAGAPVYSRNRSNTGANRRVYNRVLVHRSRIYVWRTFLPQKARKNLAFSWFVAMLFDRIFLVHKGGNNQYRFLERSDNMRIAIYYPRSNETYFCRRHNQKSTNSY